MVFFNRNCGPNYSQSSTLSLADQFIIGSANNGDYRFISANAVLEFFQTVFASPTMAVNFYTPGTGTNIALPTPVAQQQWALIQPAGALAALTLTLPLNTTTPDGTEVLVTTTQQINTFTLVANGAVTVFGAPSTLAANDTFKIRYYLNTNSWYRI